MGIELHECKPMSAKITKATCQANRMSKRFFACELCAGVVEFSGGGELPQQNDDYTVILHFREPADRRLLDDLQRESGDLENDLISLLHLAAEAK
ncbi:MAG: hypothetical protein VB050_03355 [Geobacteraceae bacterium]|nr:hypothetical protein [Geobacteraceae bacterium]